MGCLSNFGLHLKTTKCTFMQTEVVFLGHIVGRTGLACAPQNYRRSGTGMRRIRSKVYDSLLALSGICEGLCGPGETIGAFDSERRPLCVDRPSTEGV